MLYKLVYMKHRGEIVEAAVRHSGFPITQLAKRLGRSRRHVYNLFENPQIPVETILEIGKIIHHDFTSEISALKGYRVPEKTTTAIEVKADYHQPEDNPEYWKNKYFGLLEKYNALLEEKVKK